MFTGLSTRPLLIAEYGVDAYRDPCGFCVNKEVRVNVPSF
jgi:hypothetical protein